MIRLFFFFLIPLLSMPLLFFFFFLNTISYILLKQRTILKFLHKRMANVQTPKKKQGPIPQRGVPKRRRLNLLPSDDETSSASTMTPSSADLGSPSPASDAPAPDDGPDTCE